MDSITHIKFDVVLCVCVCVQIDLDGDKMVSRDEFMKAADQAQFEDDEGWKVSTPMGIQKSDNNLRLQLV